MKVLHHCIQQLIHSANLGNEVQTRNFEITENGLRQSPDLKELTHTIKGNIETRKLLYRIQ